MSTLDGTPPTVFAQARRGRLGYQQFGSGDVDVVAIPPLAQNIEVAWEWPDVAAMLHRLGSFSRYVHYDKRGTGCSDRSLDIQEHDERVEDLRAVMDHAGVGHAHLFASSDGGPTALLFAATYPDRVDGIVLFGSGASTYPFDMTAEVREAYLQAHALTASVWGTPGSWIAAGFAPSLAVDPAFHEWHVRYERLAASGESLRELLDLGLDTDVRGVLEHVRAPVLLLHRVGDVPVSIECARETAALLPDATLVELPGNDHFAYAGDMSWLDTFERWVTGTVRDRPEPASRSAVRIVTLGRFAVEVDGQEVPLAAWDGRKARVLCKRLAAARGWPVTRDELTELLWPDDDDRTRTGARLSVQLSTVRRILAGGVIADRSTVRLDLDEVDLDIADLVAGDDATVVETYAGPFLPGEVHEDWTRPARDELHGRFVTAARRRIAELREAGQAEDAVELARRVVAEDQLDLDAHADLVGLLLDLGEDAQARRAHAAWVHAGETLEIAVPPLDPAG